MTVRDDATEDTTGTESHHEPHGAAKPHGAADEIPEHDAHHPAAHDDAHHAEATVVGAIDTQMWGAAILGIALGIVVAACFLVATTGVRG
jgi:hypothetical protein